MKEDRKYFDYYGKDMFDVLEVVIQDLPNTNIAPGFTSAADICRQTMTYELFINKADPEEVAKMCADEL